MQRFHGFLVLFVALGISGCETPFGQPEDDSDARYGLRSDGPRRQQQSESLDSDTVYLGPSGNAGSQNSAPERAPQDVEGQVRLKPFRSVMSGASQDAPKPRATPRPTSEEDRPTPKPTPKSKASPTPKPKSERKTASTPNLEQAEPEPEPTSKPKPESDGPPPFASPVPGKKGYVTSPYSPDAGFIDVTGLDPGSMAKDPYSGKVFRVP
ncbi:MAG TPA: hypothetical protein VF585_05090 [Chthoniobacterales bacterium]